MKAFAPWKQQISLKDRPLISQKICELAEEPRIQIILVKLWDLGKYEQLSTLTASLGLNERRSLKQVTNRKVEFLSKH